MIMKLKIIFSSVLVSFAVIAVTSCSDLLKVDSKIALFEDENKLDNPTDTVYSVFGIVKGLQKIADRSVILGEVRGDLLKITDHANKDLVELYNYDLQNLKPSNKYNDAADYYAVINNCNFYLSRVDTTLMKDGKNVFTREYLAVLSYRAWTYLQLAQVYGQVYYVDQPILSGDAADKDKWDLLNIKEVAQCLLVEFEEQEDRFVKTGVPDYGKLGGETGSTEQSTQHTSANMFIPVRLIMGDLALWAEQYDKAAKYYRDYLADPDAAHAVGTGSILWFGYDFLVLDPQGDSYASTLGEKAEPICYIPMEADEYDGIVSDLPNIFNSTEDNDYWNQVTRSKSITNLSARQNFCFHYINPQNLSNIRPYYMADKSVKDNDLEKGDLRLQSIITVKSRKIDEFTSSKLNTSEQKLIKINPEKICLYRNDVVYLRLAEALNRAGLPKMAFAILKNGLCEDVMLDNTIISQEERLKAASMGIDTVWDYDAFRIVEYQIEDFDDASLMSGAKRTIDGVEIAKYNTQYITTMPSNPNYQAGNTMGIHSRGCGDASIDTTYTIAAKLAKMAADGTLTGDPEKDTIRAVEEYIIDEMALETCFEGYRFGDLMRIAIHRAADGGGGFAENDFLARRVASRASATLEDPWYRDADADALYQSLYGDGHSLNLNWFLKQSDE